MANNNYVAKATAQITIVDTTDASYLSGGLSVVSGSRNQIYIPAASGDSAYSPNWKFNNLVIRPFLTASNIKKANGTEYYNPDLFSPDEYPSFTTGTFKNIIDNIHWYYRDNAGVEVEITSGMEGYGFTWEYTIDGRVVSISDKRQLVINENILTPNTSMDIICKFSYNDPYANMSIGQQFSINISNIAAGTGASKVHIEAINGNTIYNNSPEYIQLDASFYYNGTEVDLTSELNNSMVNTSVLWYIRDISSNTCWRLLDATQQDFINNNSETSNKLYEVCEYETLTDSEGVISKVASPVNSSKGGTVLRIYPDLIAGSDVIKCVVSYNNAAYSELQTVYDNSDPIRMYIQSSAGDKLSRGQDNDNTILKPIIVYKGQLLDETKIEDLELLNNLFSYYWYKDTIDGSATWNVWNEYEGGLVTLKSQVVTNSNDGLTLMEGNRELYISADDIDKQNKFTLDLVDKAQVAAANSRTYLMNNQLTEDELMTASLINENAGMDSNNMDATLATAYEIQAYTQEDES